MQMEGLRQASLAERDWKKPKKPKKLQPLDMNLVRPGLYIGSKLAEMAPLEQLQQQTIEGIVDLSPAPPTHKKTLSYLNITLKSGVDAVQQLLGSTFLEFVHAVQERGSVLVCCETGMNSSATAVLLYLMRFEYMRFKDALVDVIKCRKYIGPDLASCNQLVALERFNSNPYDSRTAQMLTDEMAWYKTLREARDTAGV